MEGAIKARSVTFEGQDDLLGDCYPDSALQSLYPPRFNFGRHHSRNVTPVTYWVIVVVQYDEPPMHRMMEDHIGELWCLKFFRLVVQGEDETPFFVTNRPGIRCPIGAVIVLRCDVQSIETGRRSLN